jgi:hypothetical protein
LVRGRCTRLALPHASSITRESPGVAARILPMFESKVLRRPVANYAPKIRSCNGWRQHFGNCCVLLRARHVGRGATTRQRDFDVALRGLDGFRRGADAVCASRPRPNGPPGEHVHIFASTAWEGEAFSCATTDVMSPAAGLASAPQISVEMRIIRGSKQPPVREARLRSGANRPHPAHFLSLE